MPQIARTPAGWVGRQAERQATVAGLEVAVDALVVHGIHLIERMKLDEFAASGVSEFAFVV